MSFHYIYFSHQTLVKATIEVLHELKLRFLFIKVTVLTLGQGRDGTIHILEDVRKLQY